MTMLLDYYRQHSPITDPGRYAALYDALPDAPRQIARVIQGLLLHPGVLHLYEIPGDLVDNAVFGVRPIEGLLERILRVNPTPLTTPREPRQRLGAICRNFAVLMVSMLRYKGIPARERVGFGGYFGGSIAYDHRIAEFWDAAGERWVLIDPMIDEVQCRYRSIAFDTLDLQPGDPFTLAGAAWIGCREGRLDPNQFGDSDADRGWPPLRYALLHDFDALNKAELLGNDAWHPLIDKPEDQITAEEFDLLDRIASLTIHADHHFEGLLALHQQSAYGQAVTARLRELGL